MFDECILAATCWSDFEGALGALGPDQNVVKGRAFEELTRLYLLTDPLFSTKLTDVWHHTELPPAVFDQLDLQRPEIGVDLVARAKDGSYWAIQCKYHQDRSKNVRYDELKTFLSITERQQTYSKLSHRLVCTSADGVSDRVTKAHSDKIGFLTAADFTRLSPNEFTRFHEVLEGSVVPLVPFTPRQHQRAAVDSARQHFIEDGETRGKLIHPCGSGKSLTGYWIAKELEAKTVIIGVPSLALVRQTLESWTREAVANGEDISWLAVCSDEDVSKNDDPAMRRVDLGIDVTTDAEAVAAFFSSSQSTKVLVTTYQSGPVTSAGTRIAGGSFDIGIFDEAHKTVGDIDSKFAHLLSDENVRVAKRIYMTATERQYRGNSEDILSMDDPSVYGEIFDVLSFKAALELDPPILSDYRVVSIIITKSEIEQLVADQAFVRADGQEWSLTSDAPTFASLIALRKSIEKYGLRHTVSFHRSIQRSKDFANLNAEATKAGDGMNGLSCFHVSGKMSTGDRAAIINRFVDAVPSLVTNARCLTEGVDVPAIDAVLFADPRQSKIDIVQAAGRAMRKFKGKDLGYIIVPVVIDEEADEPSDQAFDQIITVLSALAMQDQRIIDWFESIAAGRRSFGPRLVEIDIPEYVRVEFADLLANIETKIWDRLGFGWAKGFQRLQAFVARENHARVHAQFTDETGFNLGKWVSHRRNDNKADRLSPERIATLEAMPGWTWDPIEADYQDALSRLQTYVDKEGHARVPQHFTDKSGFKLGGWVSSRRAEYKADRLSRERIAALEAMPGWVWDPIKAGYQDALIRLQAYVVREGHARVSQHFTDKSGFNLGAWVGKRRTDYNAGRLSPDWISALEAMPGWTWDPGEADFREGLTRLQNYVIGKGHARPPLRFTDETGFKLGGWVSHRRTDYKVGRLSPDRIAALEAMPGWTWDPIEADFREGLARLQAYVGKEGHARVPLRFTDKTGFKLGGWVSSRRTDYRLGRLSPERIAALEAVQGWVWDKLEADFQEGLTRLQAFVTRESHARVSREFTDGMGFKLGGWVSSRRTDYNVGRLSPDRIAALEAMPGWTWDPIEADFRDGLTMLKVFVAREGHARVHAHFTDDTGFKLGGWVSYRRNDYKVGRLSPDRIAILEAVPGWVWDARARK